MPNSLFYLLNQMGTGAPLDPTTIPGCTLWLAGSNMSGFADGDPVGDNAAGDAWPNLGSFGGNWVQVQANRRPTYQTNEVNGLPVVRFINTPAGEQDAVEGANLSNYFTVSAYTIFLVVRPTIGGGTDGSSRYYRRPRIFGGLSNDNFHIGLYNNTFRVNHNVLSGPSVATPAFTVNNWYIVEVWFGGGTLGIKSNNSADSTVSGAANISSLSFSGQLGRGTDLQFDGDIAEAIGWDNNIGSTNRGTVRNELATKYGITLLP